MTKTIIHFLLRLLVGATFIFSGASKLLFIEPFELSFVELGFGWYITPFLARFLIASEFILGLALIFNVKTKLTLKFIIGMLVFFTFYLLFLWIKTNNSADCGCFGEYLKMNPLESIVKNIVLAIPTIYLLYKNNPFKWKFEKLLIIMILVVSLFTSFAVNYIEMSKFNVINIDNSNYKLEVEKLGDFVYNNDTIKLNEGKKVVCFFSLKCKYCKLASKKLSIIRKDLDTEIPVYYILGGDVDLLPKWWEETASYPFPYLNILPGNDKQFFSLSGGALPAIYFLNDGIVWKKVDYERLHQADFEEFLEI
ncbi:MAG TPA: hypothetical protein DDX39_02255 [Bacteroidales bacterium]|nr:MAG: hypothetical protein A2W98_08875 [Bacteroidetes bacterium GWF2_33_38]OFY75405.1 MAG: hypothetical protein A2265_05630 [Bacteroidetes bacterium RIFOXYA12_FULL_33_9]OFY84978.1 MAG: hypothetical protein A2236_03150 [Bacteroidetes bacterium RIFOXYA2_FULL_33_7]HBF87437.1 hypothetical protein [Bacteroidales bacterium]